MKGERLAKVDMVAEYLLQVVLKEPDENEEVSHRKVQIRTLTFVGSPETPISPTGSSFASKAAESLPWGAGFMSEPVRLCRLLGQVSYVLPICMASAFLG